MSLNITVDADGAPVRDSNEAKVIASLMGHKMPSRPPCAEDHYRPVLDRFPHVSALHQFDIVYFAPQHPADSRYLRTSVTLEASMVVDRAHMATWLRMRLEQFEAHIKDQLSAGTPIESMTGVPGLGPLAQWLLVVANGWIPGIRWLVTAETPDSRRDRPYERVTYYSDPADA